MYSKTLSIFIAGFLSLTSYSQESIFLKYSASGIDDSLKTNANAVVRLDEGVLEISSPSRYVLKNHQIITILNKQGANHLYHTYGFDKFHKVNDIEIRVYNELGLEVRKYKKKDFEIQSAFDGFSLVTDDKIMKLSTPAPGFPCTVEIKSETIVTGYLELPNWYMNTNRESTEIFRYIVKVPSELDIRYRSKNFDLKPVTQINGNQKVYTWEIKNTPVKPLESNNYEDGHYLPQIEVVPNQFEYDGYSGRFKTWKEFGEWSYALYEQNENPFTEQRILEIKSLAATQPDISGKVASLYDYLKKNMRYVSIQLGIGGFKPFSVRFVDEKKYGDCKALTNYMRNMLAVAGIKSYPALINAGYNKSPADPVFPTSPFNHVILCVPNGKDSIWLECTSNNSLSGFLGSFTENKNALLLTENGGVLVPTPASNYLKTTLNVRTEIFLHATGGAEAFTSIHSTGDIYNTYYSLRQLSSDRQKEFFVQNLNYKLPDNFEPIRAIDSADGSVSDFRFEFEKLYDFNAGNKLFFQQRLNVLCTELPSLTENRKTEYLFDHPYEKKDTTIYHLPAGTILDNVPQSLELKNDFADYKNEILYNQSTNCILVLTYLILKKNIIPPHQYKEMATFFHSINRNQSQKIILKKE